MTVIALNAFREPSPRLLTLFCVQSYWSDRGRLAAGRFQQFGTMEAALRAGAESGRRSPAVLVYRIRGNPEADYWERPVTVAKYGDRSEELRGVCPTRRNA